MGWHPTGRDAATLPVVNDRDRLYGLPLDEFIAARNELAKKLRKEGDRSAADEVKALRKPSRPAWVVNRLARDRKKEMRALLEAGERLRRAHEDALGGGDAKPLRSAADAERKAVEKLMQGARKLEKSDAALERVRGTLHAAAGDEELRDEMEAGTVTEDRAPVGLGPFAVGAPATGGRGAKAPAKKAAAGKEKGGGAKAAGKEKGGRAKAGAKAAGGARTAAEPKQTAAERRKAAAEQRRKEAEQRRAAKEAEAAAAAARDRSRKLRELKSNQRRARKSFDAAEKALERAREQAERAAAELEERERGFRRARSEAEAADAAVEEAEAEK